VQWTLLTFDRLLFSATGVFRTGQFTVEDGSHTPMVVDDVKAVCDAFPGTFTAIWLSVETDFNNPKYVTYVYDGGGADGALADALGQLVPDFSITLAELV
jgi:hypothetical protein